jgi:predicted pyridoxine 5'-phosphate oxidase superfamily flavin-nucleotide-binding protein/NAD(P)H-flavin reductase
MKYTNKSSSTSPFHEGEVAIQERLGIREDVEAVGRRFIRPYMPDQHRDFFEQLPFMIIGSVDEQGWPWASIVSGKPGFALSPEPTVLNINTLINPLDPLSKAVRPKAKLGLLGIDTSTRRRNRMNASVNDIDKSEIKLTVDQSFGNCPKYIQTRQFEFIRNPKTSSNKTTKTEFTQLDNEAKALISTADTFFVASYILDKNNNEVQGVDASHRGGKPGFIKLEGNSMTIPDFYGNNLFNTLGNFYKNPKAGLVFADFTTGNLLMLTGTIDIIWEDDHSIKSFKGAERAWTFHLDHGFWLKDFLPFRAPLEEYSPFLESLGQWQEQTPITTSTSNDSWQNYRIERIEKESSVVKSFYLKPLETEILFNFKAGQYLPIRLHAKYSSSPHSKQYSEDIAKLIIRTYTISSAPHEPLLRISVKREKEGLASQWLHDEYKVGDTIECKKPSGEFFINIDDTRPAVLLAGGIGITPMLSMAETISHHNLTNSQQRKLSIFHASKSIEERPFYNRLQHLQLHSN